MITLLLNIVICLELVFWLLDFMLIGGLQKVSLIDYPGHIAATVFTAGCNFSCPFCHNPGLVRVGFDKYQMFLTDEEVMEFLRSRQGMLDGVCVTGGEPVLQADLSEFLAKVKELGFLVKLDTNGSRPDILQNLIKQGLLDYIAMDIKGPLEKYSKIAGMDIGLENIHKSTQIVRNFPEYEFRTTVAPNLHEKGDFLSIARWLDGSKRYFLQQFRPDKTLDPAYSTVKPYPDEKLIEFANMIRPYFGECGVRI